MSKYTEKDLDFLLSPLAIRMNAERILESTIKGDTNFNYHPEKLMDVVDYVIKVIRNNYPDLNIPFHSRWGHFRAGGIDRTKVLDEKLKELEPLEVARVKLDLVITSVLLDAGAGMSWKYVEKNSNITLSKSEGLGVASFYLFLDGSLSDKKELKSTGLGLTNLNEQTLSSAFQVSNSNPLVGVQGRLSLLHNLGQTVLSNKEIFCDARPGNIVDYLLKRYGKRVTGVQLLRTVLDGLGEIWPGRIKLANVNLGDVWNYKGDLAVYHKLSQWMTYSLIEPLGKAGFEIVDVHELTGLAEYRNGGLILDRGLITLKDKTMLAKSHRPDSELVIEWRGLTVALLDRIGSLVQKQLNKTTAEFPLAKVLEGGTWWAGRKAAKELREDGGPPIQIESDGTVF